MVNLQTHLFYITLFAVYNYKDFKLSFYLMKDIIYQSSSPDESALVRGARMLDYELTVHIYL